jgi:Tfp pilus assembly pilus retraction ATPase PilT
VAFPRRKVCPADPRQALGMSIEVLIAIQAVRSLIREDKARNLEQAITTDRKLGMCTMDSSLLELHQKAIISWGTAASRMRDTNLRRLERSTQPRPP